MSSITNEKPNSNKTANPNSTESTKDFVEKKGCEEKEINLIFSKNQNMSSNSNTTITKDMASVKHLKEIYKDFIKDKPKKERVKMMKDFGEKIKGKKQPYRKAQYRKLMEKYGGWEKRVKKPADEESVSSFGSVEEIEQEQQIEDVKEEGTISFSSSCDETSEEEIEIEEEIDQDQELKELVEKMEKKEETLLDALKEEEIVVEQLSWIEGISLSEAVFNTLPDEVKRVMIEDLKEKNRLKDELTKNTTKHFHAKRKGEVKRKPKSSKSEIYEVWSHQFNNGHPPPWFKHSLHSEDEGGVVDVWHFDYDEIWEHYVVNWEKSSTHISKTSLSFNTFLTCNENHRKATHKYLSAFNKGYVITGIQDDKLRAKALQQKYKALSKPTFTFPELPNYEECYEAMNMAKKTTKKTEKKKTSLGPSLVL